MPNGFMNKLKEPETDWIDKFALMYALVVLMSGCIAIAQFWFGEYWKPASIVLFFMGLYLHRRLEHRHPSMRWFKKKD